MKITSNSVTNIKVTTNTTTKISSVVDKQPFTAYIKKVKNDFTQKNSHNNKETAPASQISCSQRHPPELREEKNGLPSETSSHDQVAQIRAYQILNDTFRRYLQERGDQVISNSGMGHNCAIYALIQPIRSDLHSEALDNEVARIRQEYDSRNPQEQGNKLFFDSGSGGAASLLIEIVNQRYKVNAEVTMISAGLEEAHPEVVQGTYRAPGGGFPTHRLIVWDQQGHYEAVIRPSCTALQTQQPASTSKALPTRTPPSRSEQRSSGSHRVISTSCDPILFSLSEILQDISNFPVDEKAVALAGSMGLAVLDKYGSQLPLFLNEEGDTSFTQLQEYMSGQSRNKTQKAQEHAAALIVTLMATQSFGLPVENRNEPPPTWQSALLRLWAHLSVPDSKSVPSARRATGEMTLVDTRSAETDDLSHITLPRPYKTKMYPEVDRKDVVGRPGASNRVRTGEAVGLPEEHENIIRFTGTPDVSVPSSTDRPESTLLLPLTAVAVPLASTYMQALKSKEVVLGGIGLVTIAGMAAVNWIRGKTFLGSDSSADTVQVKKTDSAVDDNTSPAYLEHVQQALLEADRYLAPALLDGADNSKVLRGKWVLNAGIQVALNINQGEKLAGKTFIFTVKSAGEAELNFSYSCKKRDDRHWSSYRWLQDVAQRVNDDRLGFAVGERVGEALTPLASQYRNSIWVPLGRDGKEIYSVSWKIVTRKEVKNEQGPLPEAPRTLTNSSRLVTQLPPDMYSTGMPVSIELGDSTTPSSVNSSSVPEVPAFSEGSVQKLSPVGETSDTTVNKSETVYWTGTSQIPLTRIAGIGLLSPQEQSTLKEILDAQRVIIEELMTLNTEKFINDSIATVLNNTMLSSNSTIIATVGVVRYYWILLSRELEVEMTPRDLATGKMEKKFKAKEESSSLTNPRSFFVRFLSPEDSKFYLTTIYDEDGSRLPKNTGDNLLKLRDDIPSYYQKKVSAVFDGAAFSRAFTLSESSKLAGLSRWASEEFTGLPEQDRKALIDYASGNSTMAQIITADGDPLYGLLVFNMSNGDKLFISSQDVKNPFWLVKDGEWRVPRLQYVPEVLINDGKFKAWVAPHLSTRQIQQVVGVDKYGHKVIQFAHLTDPTNNIYLDGAVIAIDATRYGLSGSVAKLKDILERHHTIALDDQIITTTEMKTNQWSRFKMELFFGFLEMGITPCFRILRASRGAFRLLDIGRREVMENVISSLPKSLYDSYVNEESDLGTNILNSMIYGSLFSTGMSGSRKIAKTFSEWRQRYRSVNVQNGKVPSREVMIHRAKSPYSEDLAGHITPEMYADKVADGQLQHMGRGYFEDPQGNMYLHVGSSNYVRLKSLSGPDSGRFRIVDKDGRTCLLLRYDNNQFRIENLRERLGVIRQIGLSGRGQGPATQQPQAIDIIASLPGESALSAQTLLNKYKLPQDGVFSDIAFAKYYAENNAPPSWGRHYEIRPLVVVSPEKTIASVTRIPLTEEGGIVSLPTVTELKLGAEVGSGQFSTVSVDASDDRFVIKPLPTTAYNLRTKYGKAAYLKSTRQEARSFEQYYGTGSTELYQAPGGELYIRQRRVPGIPLHKISGKILPEDSVARYETMEQTLSEHNIMPNDLNSGNVLWDADSQSFYPVDLDDYTEIYLGIGKRSRGEGTAASQRTQEAVEKAKRDKATDDLRMQEVRETNIRIIQEHLAPVSAQGRQGGNTMPLGRSIEKSSTLKLVQETPPDPYVSQRPAGNDEIFSLKIDDGKYSLTSKEASPQTVVPQGSYAFVILPQNPNEILCLRSRYILEFGFGHTSATKRGPVIFAGEAHFNAGILMSWDNKSGHYKLPAVMAQTQLLPEAQRLLPMEKYTPTSAR